MSVMLPAPPRVASILAVSGSSAANWAMSWASTPNDRPATAAPMAQPSRAPRCSRQARASGLRSQAGAVAGPSRVASAPAPRSRRSRRATTTTSRTSSRATGRSRTAQRSPANGWKRSAQPIGDSQASQDRLLEVWPMARSRKATPRAAKATPLAGRAYSVSWAVTAATPANTRPLRPQATARATDPPTGSPTATYPSTLSAARTTLTPSTNSRLAASQALRPTAPALTGPAGLLLLAGVAGHQQQAHEADEEDPGGDHLPGGGPAVGAGVIGRALQGHHRRVGPDAGGRPGQPVQVGLGRVERDDAGRLAEHEHEQPQDPDGGHDPVAAHGQPQQLAGAGEPTAWRRPGAHRGSLCARRAH